MGGDQIQITSKTKDKKLPNILSVEEVKSFKN